MDPEQVLDQYEQESKCVVITDGVIKSIVVDDEVVYQADGQD